ncbi:hypothetical protein BS47DRAFT_1485270 [Hydnum rufescens UP504]|uniref:Uncharacterized protein n=1 Tax=Hydnum rufescens UP504 TaxID=1448309 RepID=A0A9P6DX19_9AGAM|nr:hypothetical protein BS47DRAFT_1485270 [Hydnum rufescens UP504]
MLYKVWAGFGQTSARTEIKIHRAASSRQSLTTTAYLNTQLAPGFSVLPSVLTSGATGTLVLVVEKRQQEQPPERDSYAETVMAQSASGLRDADILEYYHSQHANAGAQSSSDESERRAFNRHRPSPSPSEEEYDPSHRLSSATVRGEADVTLRSGTPPPGAALTPNVADIKRRPSARAAANADNRRLAIVELDRRVSNESSQYPSNGSSDISSSSDTSQRLARESSLSSRRGMDQPRMALIAPPDAAPSSYTNLAPSDRVSYRNSTGQHGLTKVPSLQHKRTKSSGDPFKSLTPGDANVPNSDGQQHPSVASSPSTAAQGRSVRNGGRSAESEDIIIPIEPVLPVAPYQNAETRAGASLGNLWSSPEVGTPDIGQGKQVGARVAGPHVHILSNSEMNWAVPTPHDGYPTQPHRATAGDDFPAEQVSLISTSRDPGPSKPPSTLNDMSYMFFDSALHGTAGPPPEIPKVLQIPLQSHTPLSPALPPPRPPRRGAHSNPHQYPSIHDVQLAFVPPLEHQEQMSLSSVSTGTPPRPVRHAREQASHEPPFPAHDRSYEETQSDAASTTLARTLSQSSVTSTSTDSTSTTSSASGSIYSDDLYRSPKHRSEDKYATVRSEGRSSARPSLEGAFSPNPPPPQSYHREEATIVSAEAPLPPAKDDIYLHNRDGATASSSVGTIDDLMAAVGDAIDDIGLVNAKDVPPPTVVQPSWEEKKQPSPSRPALGLRRGSTSSSSFASTHGGDRRSGEENEDLELYPTQSISSAEQKKPYTPPSTADSGHSSSSRSNDSKLFSAIRHTTSSLSLSRFPIHLARSKTDSVPFAPTTIFSQPPVTTPEKTRRLKRKVVGYPQAMSFQDVMKMRTALDRAAGYAEKINQLYAEDCGLDAWIAGVKSRKKGGQRATDTESDLLSPLKSPSMAASAHVHQLTRHMSRNSMASEVTFPIRPDAYVATNLRAHETEDSPPQGLSPSLPYPSLAVGIGSRNHPSGSNLSGGKPGFFASIGRRASLKKERNHVLQPGYRPPARLPLSTPSPALRSVQIENSPQIPGGPRAQPPRNSTLMPHFAPSLGSPRPAPSTSADSPMSQAPKAYLPNSPRTSESVDRSSRFLLPWLDTVDTSLRVYAATILLFVDFRRILLWIGHTTSSPRVSLELNDPFLTVANFLIPLSMSHLPARTPMEAHEAPTLGQVRKVWIEAGDYIWTICFHLPGHIFVGASVEALLLYRE